MVEYKVLLTTSGIGSRLGTLTSYTNKSLVTVGNRAAISQIIESYPDNIEIVITIGYYGDHVCDYVSLSYPNKNITFIEVDNYDGPGSSLVYSMLCAKDQLQCPFIFHACDTLVLDNIPLPDKNWLGGFKGDESSEYRTLKVTGHSIQTICEKGEQTFDSIYIGLAGIYNWKEFWNIAEKIYDCSVPQSDLNIIQQMIDNDINFELINFKEWYDIGNIKSLQKARQCFTKSFNVLDKEEESLNVFSDYVIKFFHDSEIVKKRVKRNEILRGIVPEIVSYRDNFYKYRKVHGEVLSKTVTENIFKNLLDWSIENLWNKEKEDESFYTNCEDFYFNKTLKRLKTFKAKTGRKDKIEFINECEVPSVETLMSDIPHEILCSKSGYNFHGDFILPNIIYNNGSFTLIDWRQDFAGNLEYGDIHYDLAKLFHNLIFNHDLIEKKYYKIDISPSNINVDILRWDLFCRLEKILFQFIRDKEFDEQKVRILAPIIWINMSALHEHPLNLFLYYWGRYNLYIILKIYNIYK
jgi:choline kinase